MDVIADPGLVSGFVYNDPLPRCDWLSHCGEAECAGVHHVPLHRHHTFELMYLTHGRYFWRIGRRRITQRAGELFVVRPGELHGTARPPGELVGQLWLGVDITQFGSAGRSLAAELLREDSRIIRGCQDVEPLIRTIVRQVVRNRPGRQAVVRASLGAILQIIRQCRHPATEEQPIYSYPVAKAMQYLHTHLHDRVHLRQLTLVAGCGVSLLSRLFRKEVSQSPMDYHRLLRLKAARDALRSPDASITSVAMRFGFSSSQHLSTSFRQAFGTTPKQWTKACRKHSRADR